MEIENGKLKTEKGGRKMKEDWKECKLGEIVEMNPTESIKKGTFSKRISRIN